MDDDSDLEEENKEKAFIKLENVHKTYLLGIEGIAALRGVDLDVKEGEFLMICGTSGGGKSTMLNIIGTIDKPTKGRVTICEKIITPRTSDDELAKIRLENLGFVFQTFNLLSSMTAVENVELPLTFLGFNAKKRKEMATRLLKMVQMGDRLDHYPTMLSGGEQQRVTIARAMANMPGLLLLDEPTGDLDTLNTNNVMRLLLNLNKRGTTLVMVTHDMNLVAYGTRVVYMRDGKVSGGHINTAEDRAAKIADLEEQLRLGRDGSKSGNVLDAEKLPDNGLTTSTIHAPSSSSSSTPSQLHSGPNSPSTIFPSVPNSPLHAPALLSSSSYPSAPSVTRFTTSGAVVPQCTSVREPGDYDPIAAADQTLMGEVGYEVSLADLDAEIPIITKIRPYNENPYSNLRPEVVVKKKSKARNFEPGSSSSTSSRPSSASNLSPTTSENNSTHVNPEGSPATVFIQTTISPSSTPEFSLPTPSPSLVVSPTPGMRAGVGRGVVEKEEEEEEEEGGVGEQVLKATRLKSPKPSSGSGKRGKGKKSLPPS